VKTATNEYKFALFRTNAEDKQLGKWEGALSLAVWVQNETSNNELVSVCEALVKQHFAGWIVGDSRMPPNFSGWSIDYFLSDDERAKLGEDCTAIVKVQYSLIREVNKRTFVPVNPFFYSEDTSLD
jgi:hypothetical protein